MQYNCVNNQNLENYVINMNVIRRFVAGSICFLVILNLTLCLSSCRSTKKTVSWFDSDGSLITTEEVSADYDPSERELPDDSDEWHYTGWTVTESGNVTVCTANRAAKTNLVWKDYDGNVLFEDFITDEEEEPEYDLPEDTDKWRYTEWDKIKEDGTYVYTAEREPNGDYFVGNVFQIVIKDKSGELIGSGSGFVINHDGWFVTNNHVMEKGYTATAFFDIKDTLEGGKYTQLKILGGVYNSEEKDIFIGKLDGYRRLAEHYKEISFTEDYSQGEECYSVGYPNSSVEMDINPGTVTEEYSDLYSKVSGIYYILSDSYIAPGSSGGVLVNSDFEVIGITSIGFYSDEEKQDYTSGGSIPYSVFKSKLKDLDEKKLRSISEIYKNQTLEDKE